MPQRIIQTALILFLVGLAPVVAQTPIPEFTISAAPSVVTVVQGQVASLAVTVACNTASLKAVADCNARPEFGIHLSQLPFGVQAQIAPGRVGVNTVELHASSEAGLGSSRVQATVTAGDTTQVQTFLLNVRPAPAAPPPPVVKAEVVKPSPVVHWEHHMAIAKTPEDLDRLANELGKDSWELVSVTTRQTRGSTEWVGFFKRAKR
ncbi:MAG TPA: hypothetical protein VJ723_07755 [Candidatus Angelobacter sp.]|nr:hypothetical protein [Candidatus Angelobacter sp.]